MLVSRIIVEFSSIIVLGRVRIQEVTFHISPKVKTAITWHQELKLSITKSTVMVKNAMIESYL